LLALLTVVPCAVAFQSERPDAGWAYLLVLALLAGLAWLGSRLPPVELLQRNEARCIVALTFVATSVLMSVPLMTYGIPFADAWFEAVSGVTTTGLSTLDVSDKPAAFLFARSWLQWLGGIGVVVLALALLPPGRASKSLGFSRVEMGDAVGGTRAHARRVLVVYGMLTVIGVLALLAAGALPFDALLLAMTSVSTGGFSQYADSIASASPQVVVVINVLCVAGAVSFHVYYVSILKFRGARFLDNQFHALLVLMALFAATIILVSALTGAGLRWQDVLSLVVSAQTTTGFSTVSVGALPAWLILLLCLSMLVGGGIGSTAGGIKIGRLLLGLAWIRSYFVRASLPESAYSDVRFAGEPVTTDDLEDVFAVIGAYVGVLFVSWFLFVVHGYPPLSALFEVISALSTVGLSVGVTSAELPALLKAVLCFDMLFGRVEVVALVILLLPRTWIGRRRSL
jgi:trk system potassium uptake protein TrkH